MADATVAIAGLPAQPGLPPAHWYLQWEGPLRNATRSLAGLTGALPRALSTRGLDLLDFATAVYLLDLAVPRGRNEHWVRHLHLTVAVREPGLWQTLADDLTYLLYVLTRDAVELRFCDALAEEAAAQPGERGTPASSSRRPAPDCVCLLSGGLDSLAGAATLLRTGRRPLLVSHHSGNARLRQAQGAAGQSLRRLAPASSRHARFALQGGGRPASPYRFPPPGQREPSQRSRSLLFMALALATAEAAGVSEAFLFDNGIMTIALPLSEARVGGFSTRSTHPKVLALMNALAATLGLNCQLQNPFNYQTKAELVRDLLRPVMAPFEIQRTVSCWSAGRTSRQCGGCTACLLRRTALLAAGLPDEAYEIDVLAAPDRYRGTDAHSNLIDLLGQATRFLTCSDSALLAGYPELLDLPAVGIHVDEVLAMYRRHAEQVIGVIRQQFPAAAALL